MINCDTSRANDADVIRAAEWITEHHEPRAIVNASLWTNYNPMVDAAVQNSISAGVTWVIAAGNFKALASDYSLSGIDAAIVVGATNSSDSRWVDSSGPFGSNYGGTLDVFAPGVDIMSADIDSDQDHVLRTGTSMATPHVTGIAARYLGLFGNATPTDVQTAIVEGAAEVNIGNEGAGSPELLANSQFLDYDPPPPPTPPCGDSDCLLSGEILYPGWYLESTSMQYILSYQGDGNLVMYDSSWNVLWAANTDGTDANIAAMQGDGNFVVYDDGWNVPWASNTQGNNGAWLIIQNDGNLVIYGANNGPPIRSIRYECTPQCS